MREMNRSLFRRIVMAALILPLLAISNSTQKSLQQDRKRLDLTHSQPLDNAPPALAFTTVALGGFRGIIANALWIRASEMQEEERFFELIQLSDWITKLQPRFASVWSFQSWNLAYNVSVKFPDDASRWNWVHEGITMLRDHGIQYNPDTDDLYYRLAYMFQHKMGDDLDSAHRYYKGAWKEKMEELFDGRGPDWDRILNPQSEDDHARLHELRDTYKMDPTFMKQVDDKYGPLEWRLPESHAVYWAAYGLEHATRKRPIDLRRVVYQSLQTAVHRGRIIDYSEDANFELVPNPSLIEPANNAYLEMIRDDFAMNKNIGEAHQNFLIYAITLLDGADRKAEAEHWFAYLAKEYPEALKEFEGYRDMIQKRIVEDAVKGGPDKVRKVLRSLLTRHFRFMAGDAGDLAAVMLDKARRVRKEYYIRYRRADQDRIQMPPMESLYQDVLKELTHNPPPVGYSDAMAARLCTVLRIPYPAEERAKKAPQTALKPDISYASGTPEENLKKSREFLDQNGRKDGVITSQSGLQIKIIKEGKGKRPTRDSTVRVHYDGRLLNGLVFDSSRETGKPLDAVVRGLIEGWQEGLTRMKGGGRRILFVPPELGYGKSSQGIIPPNSVLIFDVELVKVHD